MYHVCIFSAKTVPETQLSKDITLSRLVFCIYNFIYIFLLKWSLNWEKIMAIQMCNSASMNISTWKEFPCNLYIYNVMHWVNSVSLKVVLPRIFHILSIHLSPEKHLRLDWKHTSNAKIWSSIQEYVFTNLAYLKLQKLNLSLL